MDRFLPRSLHKLIIVISCWWREMNVPIQQVTLDFLQLSSFLGLVTRNLLSSRSPFSFSFFGIPSIENMLLILVWCVSQSKKRVSFVDWEYPHCLSRSATFSVATGECRISDMDRHTVAGTSAFTVSFKTTSCNSSQAGTKELGLSTWPLHRRVWGTSTWRTTAWTIRSSSVTSNS